MNFHLKQRDNGDNTFWRSMRYWGMEMEAAKQQTPPELQCRADYDGTNENNDTRNSSLGHPSNLWRLTRR